jgi:hypothetical protein
MGSKQTEAPTKKKKVFEDSPKDRGSQASSKPSKIKEMLTPHVQGIKNSVKSNRKVQKLVAGLDKLLETTESHGFQLRFDEFSFFFAFYSLLLTFALIFYPETNLLIIWYLTVNSVLLVIRYIDYKSRKWHYYYFDYCYFINFASFIYLICCPKSLDFFLVVFVNCSAPLLNYFVVFTTKIIFHSRESVTSFYMHYTPGLVFWVLRYYNPREVNRYIPTQALDDFIQNASLKTWLLIYLKGVAFYASWVLLYYICVLKLLNRRMTARSYPSLYTYFKFEIKVYNPLMLLCGERWEKEMYSCFHLLQGVVGNLMSLLLLRYHGLATLALCLYIIPPIKNTAVYYFEYFSKDYHKKLEEKVGKLKESRDKHREQRGSDQEDQMFQEVS